MKRVLIVNWRWYNTGGDWTYLLSLVELYRSEGFQIYGLSTFSVKNQNIDGVKLFTVKGLLQSDNLKRDKYLYPYRLWHQSELSKSLLGELIELKFTLVHVNSIHNSVGTRFLLQLPRKIPIFYTLHDYHLTCPVTKHIDSEEKICKDCINESTFSVVEKRCREGHLLKSFASYYSFHRSSNSEVFERVNLFICPSEFIRSMHLSRGIARSKLVVVNNPVAINEDASNKGGIKQNSNFVFIGRYERIKGIMTLLKAINELEDVSLNLYGKGPLNREIDDFIVKNNLQSRICNNGFVDRASINGIIENASALVIPSEWLENYPYSVSEALAMGVPVIGSNVGGIPEMIYPGLNGLIFEHGNVEDLKLKLKLFNQQGVKWSRGKIRKQSEQKRGLDLWHHKMLEIMRTSGL